MDVVLLAASRPWTYWIAPVLEATGVCAIVAMAYGYCRNVLDPYYRLIDHRAQGQLASPTAEVASLEDARRPRQQSVPRRRAA